MCNEAGPGEPKERVIDIGTQKYTKVVCNDEPSFGGACHRYQVESVPTRENEPTSILTMVIFQKGPIKENGVNGCHHEDLIAIVMDRLQHFQKGDYNCVENEVALTHLQSALDVLRSRTTKREERGVEGTSAK